MKKTWLRAVAFVAAAVLCGGVIEATQNTTASIIPAPAPAHAQFFAGTVVELDSNHVKVTRTLAGRPTESRSFAINGSTKINKSVIKLRSRVTVRYKHLDESDVALEIQPRPVIVRTPKA